LFIRQQTAVINVIRAHLAEFGIVAPVGRKGVEALLDVVANPTDKRVPVIARACLAALGAQLCRLKEQILEFDRMIVTWHRSQETSKRLDAIPGVGPVLATESIRRVWPEALNSRLNTMCAFGHWRTFRSALVHVCFGPKADIETANLARHRCWVRESRRRLPKTEPIKL
jgi:hypothetical protein